MALSALPAAHGRVWSGTLINSPFSGELGRFAYGPGGGTAAVTVPANPLAPKQAQLSSYTEATWKAASPPSCTSATDGALAFTTSSTAPVTATASFAGGDKTRWVFALAGQPTGLYPPCPSLSADYTLTALQANGSQLSYEEQGLPAIYACFWVFMVLALGAHAYGHIVAPLPQGYPKGARPPLVVALLVALTLHATSDTFHLIEWAYVDITGKESGYFLAVMGGLLRLGALACIWVMAAFLATGYGVTTRRVALMENNNWRGALLLGVLVILGLTATFLYASATRGTPNPSAAGVGITLVFFTLGCVAGGAPRRPSCPWAHPPLPPQPPALQVPRMVCETDNEHYCSRGVSAQEDAAQQPPVDHSGHLFDSALCRNSQCVGRGAALQAARTHTHTSLPPSVLPTYLARRQATRCPRMRRCASPWGWTCSSRRPAPCCTCSFCGPPGPQRPFTPWTPCWGALTLAWRRPMRTCPWPRMRQQRLGWCNTC